MASDDARLDKQLQTRRDVAGPSAAVSRSSSSQSLTTPYASSGSATGHGHSYRTLPSGAEEQPAPYLQNRAAHTGSRMSQDAYARANSPPAAAAASLSINASVGPSCSTNSSSYTATGGTSCGRDSISGLRRICSAIIVAGPDNPNVDAGTQQLHQGFSYAAAAAPPETQTSRSTTGSGAPHDIPSVPSNQTQGSVASRSAASSSSQSQRSNLGNSAGQGAPPSAAAAAAAVDRSISKLMVQDLKYNGILKSIDTSGGVQVITRCLQPGQACAQCCMFNRDLGRTHNCNASNAPLILLYLHKLVHGCLAKIRPKLVEKDRSVIRSELNINTCS